MNKIIVGRSIEGISLNGLEYLTDENGEIMKFPTRDHAIAYLKKHGVDDEEIYFMQFIYTNESRECNCSMCESDCEYRNNPMRHPVGASTMGLGKCPKLK